MMLLDIYHERSLYKELKIVYIQKGRHIMQLRLVLKELKTIMASYIGCLVHPFWQFQRQQNIPRILFRTEYLRNSFIP